MTTWAIIPVKRLNESKRRLAHVLSPQERAALIFRFLDDMLAVIETAPGIDHTLLVTGDPTVAELAESRGAAVLLERDPAGLNSAVAEGVSRAIEERATAVLILPADLPFARAEDIEVMLRPLDSRDSPLLAICADETEDGTNALLLAPPDDFAFHYGPGSYRAHLIEAASRGRAIHVVDAPGLHFDLDTESDWLAYSGQWLAAISD